MPSSSRIFYVDLIGDMHAVIFRLRKIQRLLCALNEPLACVTHKILGAETSELAPGRSAFLLADQLLEQSPEGEAVFALAGEPPKPLRGFPRSRSVPGYGSRGSPLCGDCRQAFGLPPRHAPSRWHIRLSPAGHRLTCPERRYWVGAARSGTD